MSNFKAEFVRRVLKDQGARLHEKEGLEIQRRLRFHTGTLHSKRSEQVTASDGSMDGVLTFTRTAVQRFLDIKRPIRNKRNNRLVKRNRRIYNRFMFGTYYSTANRLMYEYTEEARDSIIKDFNELNNG